MTYDKRLHYSTLPTDSTRLRSKSERAYHVFSEALSEAHESGENLPNCDENPALWADYASDVSPEMAEEMCGTGNSKCPLFALCYNFAMLEKPSAGIWHGVSYEHPEWPND